MRQPAVRERGRGEAQARERESECDQPPEHRRRVARKGPFEGLGPDLFRETSATGR